MIEVDAPSSSVLPRATADENDVENNAESTISFTAVNGHDDDSAALAVQAFARLAVEDDDDENNNDPLSPMISSFHTNKQPDGNLLFDFELSEFSTEELMAALSVLNNNDDKDALIVASDDHDAGNGDDDHDNNLGALLLDPLPEIAFDYQEDDDGNDLLEPIDDIQNVFEDYGMYRDSSGQEDADDEDENHQEEEEEEEGERDFVDDGPDNLSPNDADADLPNILDQLGELALQDDAKNYDDINSHTLLLNDDDNDGDSVDDELELCCQPCTPVELQIQWKEENTRLAIEQARHFAPVTDQDIDELLQHFSGSLALERQLSGNQPSIRLASAGNDSDEHNNNEYDYNSDEQPSRQVPSEPRPKALQAAQPLLNAFQPQANDTISCEQVCLGGHKERILGLAFDDTGRFLATASQDSNVCIWDGKDIKYTMVGKLVHNAEFECLRVAWASSTWASQQSIFTHRPKYLLATGTAEGLVHVYGTEDPTKNELWKLLYTIDHGVFDHLREILVDDTDKPQIYALQFIDHWKALPNADDDAMNSFLLTSSNDSVHLWELDAQKKSKVHDDGTFEHALHLREVMSLRFTHLHGMGYGVRLCQVTGRAVLSSLPSATSVISAEAEADDTPYGGHRNPHGIIFVFDASYSASNGLLGVALSDGSLRLMNGRGVCLSVMQLPGVQAHLTSFAWDSSGTRLATSVATGHVITWSIANVTSHTGVEELNTSCTSVMQGGHVPGRPLFGVAYCGENEELLISWGVDGRLCLWDSRSEEGDVDEPLAILLDRPDYPIFAVDLFLAKGLIAVGGGADGGFIGIPAYVYKYQQAGVQKHQSKKAKSTTDNDDTADQDEDVDEQTIE